MNEQLHGAAAAPITLGRYHLSEPLGAGPTGEVFRAKVYGVAGFERQFAVKRFYGALSDDAPTAQRLANAARAYQTIEHPRIARLHEYGAIEGQTFVAVELVRGLDLGRLIELTHRLGDKFSPGAALTVVVQIARAVGYAHGRGVLHGGICPSNVLASPDGDVKITDFGFLAARLGRPRVDDASLAFRLPYLAPEQLAGQPSTPATDVFQLATLAYELFTGERAFSGQTPQETAAAVRGANPPTLPVPLPLLQVFKRAFQRVPEERYLDAGALADALDAANRMAPLAGGRSDVGAAVRRAQARRDELAAGQMSGAMTLPMLSRQAVHDIGVAPSVPGDDEDTNVAAIPAAPSGGWEEAPVDHQAVIEGTEDKSTPPPEEITNVAAPPQGGYYGSPQSEPPPADAMALEVPPDGGSWAETTTGTQDEPTMARGGGDEEGYYQVELKGESQLGMEPPSTTGMTPMPELTTEEEVSEVQTLVRGGHLPGVTARPSMPALPLMNEPSVVTSLPSMEEATTTVQERGPPRVPSLPQDASVPSLSTSAVGGAPMPAPARSGGNAMKWVIALAVLLVAAGGLAMLLRGGGDQPEGPDVITDYPVVVPTEVDASAVAGSDVDAADLPRVEVPPPMAGKLVIHSTPSGAVVYLDGAKKGRTPVELPATPDKHQLALLKEGHKLVRQEIAGDGRVDVPLEKVKKKGSGTGGIKVECATPERYYVIVEGEHTGEICPTDRILRPKGTYAVEVYDPVTQSVTPHQVNIKQTRFSTRVWIKD